MCGEWDMERVERVERDMKKKKSSSDKKDIATIRVSEARLDGSTAKLWVSSLESCFLSLSLVKYIPLDTIF